LTVTSPVLGLAAVTDTLRVEGLPNSCRLKSNELPAVGVAAEENRPLLTKSRSKARRMTPEKVTAGLALLIFASSEKVL